MRKTIILSTLAMFYSHSAWAGGFEPKTMLDPMSSRSIDRGLVLGKGWWEFTLGSDVKLSTGYWNSEGEQVDFASTNWTYSTQYLNFRYGITRRAEVYWKLKTHYVSLMNDDLGTNTDQFGVGDPEFGYKFDVYRVLSPLTSVIVYANYKAPFANEAPGNYVGGPNTFSAFVLTTGTADLTLGTQGKKQFGPMALSLDLGYVVRFSGLALYAIETELNQFMMRVDPGDILRVDTKGELQLGPINLSGGALYQQRQAFKIGNTVQSVLPSRDLDVIIDSDGWSLDAYTGLTFNFSNRADLIVRAQFPIYGEDLQFFPIEEIHPTYGNVYTGAFAFRF